MPNKQRELDNDHQYKHEKDTVEMRTCWHHKPKLCWEKGTIT